MAVKLWYEYRKQADNPDLVLLHGWGMDSRVWGDFAAALSEHFSLFLVDLPGLGRSLDAPQSYTSEVVAEKLAEIAPQTAYWLGWSMGGQIATVFAERYPERVKALATIASNPCFVQRTDWPCAMPEETHTAFEQSLSANQAKTLQRFIMLQTQGSAEGKTILKQLKNLLQQQQHSHAEASLTPLREDLRGALTALQMPLLQLFGEKDQLVPSSAASACAALTQQKTITYSEAGHLPFLSHQQQVVDDLLTFYGDAS